MRRLQAICLLLLAGLLPASAVDFATDRLQSIAKCLSLPGLDALGPGTHNTFSYRARTVSVRINEYGEVCHIGFLLFPKDFREASPSPVHDFLERDLLERQLPNLDGAIRHLLAHEHVYFLKGSASTVFSLKGDEAFQEEHIDLKSYRVTWSRGGRDILKMSFDMDYQTLSGCNAMELERRYPAELMRFKPDLQLPDDTSDLPATGQTCVRKGDTLFIKEMRNDLYYERKNGEWQLTNNPKMPTQTLANMMISPLFNGNATMNLRLKKYTYEDETMTLPYSQWLLKGIEEGCKPYFSIKEKTKTGYTGTVILVNRRGGYAHLLRMEASDKMLQAGGKGTIDGELYIYIPLHNVNDQYFKR